MKKIVILRPQMYKYLTNDACVGRKAKGTKRSV